MRLCLSKYGGGSIGFSGEIALAWVEGGIGMGGTALVFGGGESVKSMVSTLGVFCRDALVLRSLAHPL